MTNATIILNESIRLMNDGILRGTGRFVEIEDQNGNKQQLELPEAIHTYAAWKQIGRQVKRGEKCKARFYIWKQGKGKTAIDEETGEEHQTPGRMFMKESYFFTFDQTEPARA